MKRGEILDAVKKTITQDRNNRHGEPENSFPRIAEVWSDYLQRIDVLDPRADLMPSDVAEMLAMFKTVRFEMQPDNPDNEHDRIGYYAIAAELRAAERESVAATYASNDFNIVLEDDATPVSDEIVKGLQQVEQPRPKTMLGGFAVNRFVRLHEGLECDDRSPFVGETVARASKGGECVKIYKYLDSVTGWQTVLTLSDSGSLKRYLQALDQ